MNLTKNSDLHMHSTASDGGYSPSELMRKCKENGLEIVSLTDHDTVDGLKEARAEAKKLNIQFIPGIELSTVHMGRSVHILGYQIDPENQKLKKRLAEEKAIRQERAKKMIENLAHANINITMEQVDHYSRGGTVGRPHVAQALMDAGYVHNVSEAFELYLKKGRIGYVTKQKDMTVKEAIQWIHQAGGIAVVAHPVYYHLDDEIIKWVTEWNLDGIEVYHRDHNEVTLQHYEELCNKLDENRKVPLYRTGGSDFHHEDYGRVLQPLGVTRVHNYLAERLLDC